MSPKIAVILYKSKTLNNGEHPLMLRITHHGKRKYISLGISSPLSLWDEQKNTPKRTHTNKDFIKAVIQQKITAYQQAILQTQDSEHSPELLITTVEKGPRKQQLVFPFLDEIIDRLIEAGKVGNANVYKDTRRVMKHFTSNEKLLFTDIDLAFLNQFEVFLSGKGMAGTTLSVYFRTLRAVYNKAIQEERVKADNYPFKKFNVSKFNTRTKKRAISKEEIQKLAGLVLPLDSTLFEARAYFLFSYYGQGINFKDMAHLSWRNLVKGRIFYQRAKTGKYLQFKLLPPAQVFIDHYRSLTGQEPDNYIFPILQRDVHVTPQQLDNRLEKVIKRVNRDLKQLAKQVGISINLTTYVARHTYATVLKQSGVAIPVISEAMGHENVAITQTYLKSFENEVIDEANEHLL